VKKLDIVHHKFIMIFLMLVVFVVGVYFGVMLMGNGPNSMLVLLFGLVFLHTVILYVLFTQLVHIQDALGGKKK